METTKRIFKVEPRQIVFIRYTIESYDGMAVVRTVDPREALIEVQIAPGCEDLMAELLDALVKEESVTLIPLEGPGREKGAQAPSAGNS